MTVKKNTRYSLGSIGLLLITLFCAFNTLPENNRFELARREIMLRKIGHEVLLHAGDSTSRILPVKKIAENEYQIRFENEFTFQPDTLVSIIRNTFAKNNLPEDYIVNVLKCGSPDVIFGYAIFGTEKNELVPCSGRKQTSSCYVIDLKFRSGTTTTFPQNYLLAGLPLLALVGFLIGRKTVKIPGKETGPHTSTDAAIRIGNTLFDPQNRLLNFGDATTELTVKENKLLGIFARAPNTIIERKTLQKEIWEDEGVIVGRSLDVFISKLRKKLEPDTTIQLVNIHSKGYKLNIEQ